MAITMVTQAIKGLYNSIFSLGDKKAENIKKIALNILASIGLSSFVFSSKLGLNTKAASTAGAISLMLYYAAAKVKVNSKADKSNMTYFDFPRTEKHEKAIDTIISGIALKSYLRIAARAASLYKAGDVIHYHEKEGKIYGVHTLRFFGYIFSKKERRQNMKTLFGYTGALSIVKKTYIKRVSEVLDGLYHDNQIVPYLGDFVDEVYKDDKVSGKDKKALVNDLKEIANSKEKNKWENFLQHLIDTTTNIA